MGAWIEIVCWMKVTALFTVAPLVGAWLEIITSSFGILRAHGSLPSWERGLKCYDRHQYPPLSWSLPSWERGLKFEIDKICIRIELVAPLVGAWIEIGIFWRRAGL